MARVSLAQFIAIAAAVLDTDEASLTPAVKVGPAESALAAPFAEFAGHVRFPDGIHRAAVACSRIIRNHPLPDGNKRTAYVVMDLMLGDLGLSIQGEAEVIAARVEALAAGTMNEDEFIAWVEASSSTQA